MTLHHRVRIRPRALVLCLVLLGAAVFAQGAPPKRVAFASSADIAAAMARATASPTTAASLLPEDVFQYVVTSRKRPGSAEIHDSWSDITIIRSGKGVLRTGRSVVNQRKTAPGEWRGDTIRDVSERQVNVGDLVVIPAGTPHQFEPLGSEPLIYVTVKVPARGTAPSQ